jgi:Protein of unknown function (DUF2934)
MGQNEDLYQEIARQAYYLYIDRGFIDGNDLDDWLRAESIVVQLRAKSEGKGSAGKAKKATAKSVRK